MSSVDVLTWTELQEAPQSVQRQSALLASPLAELVGHLKRNPPGLVLTCARGSSAHAATFGKHLIERHLGIPVAAAAPNIATIYRKPMRLNGQLFLAVSQSGRSDDLVECTRMAKAAGALTAALVNDADSPLARASDIVLPMAAGAETSVLATKTFVASLAALLRLIAAWSDDRALSAAIERLPGRLAAATELDWSAALRVLAGAASLVTIGRGPTLAIAREGALKLKEGCGLHAEAFSGAEFLHGPVALVSPLYPVVLFMPTDAAAVGMAELAADLTRKGAGVVRLGPTHDANELSALPPEHPDTDAVCLIQSFYRLVVALAERRGTDLDAPPYLQKVTSTR